MAVSFVAQANTGADEFQTSRSVAVPGAVVDGDVAACVLSQWDIHPVVTPPAGAVLRGTITTGATRSLVYLIYIDGHTTLEFTWGEQVWSALQAIFFTGVDQGLDLLTVPFNPLTGSGTSVGTVTATTVADAGLAWHVNTTEYSSATTHAPPTSFTETADFDPLASAYRISPGAGSQSASGATISNSLPWATALVALAPAAGAGGPSGTFAVADVASVGFVGARDSSASFAVPDVAGVEWTATRESAAAFAIDDVTIVEWTGARDSTATFDVDSTATVGWTGAITVTASFSVDAVVTVAWIGVGAEGALAAIIVGAVTGPSRHVETITGPVLRREVTGPTVRREITGPQLESAGVDGPSRHVDDVEGPELSRVLTGPDVARVLTGAGA